MRPGAAAWIGWFLCILLLVWLGTVSPASGVRKQPPATNAPYRARIVEIAPDQSSLRVIQTTTKGRPTRDLVVPGKDDAGKALRALLKSSQSGDLVEVTETVGQTLHPALAKLEVQTLAIPAGERWLTLVGAALLLLLFGAAALGKQFGGLVVGLDGRTSNSKFQLVVWFGVVMVAYLSALWLRFCYSSNWLLGTVTIPDHLLAISGLSALSFAGAKAITQGKQNASIEAGLPGKLPANRPPRLSDLVLDDAENPDLGDFQMLLVTLVAAITYLIQTFMFLSSVELHGAITIPDADSTLLAAFGLGQGAYLAKKFASGPKPTQAPLAGGAGGAQPALPVGAAPPAAAPPFAQAAVGDAQVAGVPPAVVQPNPGGRLGVES